MLFIVILGQVLKEHKEQWQLCFKLRHLFIYNPYKGILHSDPSKQTAATADPPPILPEVFYLWHNISIFWWVMVPLSVVKHVHFDYSDLGAILDILNSLLWIPSCVFYCLDNSWFREYLAEISDCSCNWGISMGSSGVRYDWNLVLD